MNLDDPIDDGRCFACGKDNDSGLGLVFSKDEAGGVKAQTTLAARFQGWQGVAHGGIVAALLDEVMAHAALFSGVRGVTAAMRLRFRRAVPLGVPLVLTGHVEWVRRNILHAKGRITDESGALLAESEGEFVSRGPL